MVVLKVVTLIVAGIVTMLAVHKVMGELQTAKAKARVHPADGRRAPVRLRQDPRTGVYYPED